MEYGSEVFGNYVLDADITSPTKPHNTAKRLGGRFITFWHNFWRLMGRANRGLWQRVWAGFLLADKRHGAITAIATVAIVAFTISYVTYSQKQWEEMRNAGRPWIRMSERLTLKRSPSFEVIDAPLVSLEGQNLSGILQNFGTSPARREYEMFRTLNGVPTVDGVKYPCSSVGVNSAISASIAAGGGTVDARPCPSLSSYTSEIDVGNGSSVAVTLLLPSNGTWSCNITDRASYCLKVFNNGAAIGSNAGYGTFQIQPANSSVNVGALCGNDTSVANAHIRVEGFACNVFSGTATVSKAVGTFSGLGDGSYIGHMTFANLSSTNAPKVLWVNNSCCSTTIEDTVADAFAVVGVTPCFFGNGVTGPNLNIKADGLSCVHPGNGASNLVDQEWNQFGNNVFKNIYMEMFTNTDTTTPWVSVQKFGTPTAADYFVGITAVLRFRLGTT